MTPLRLGCVVEGDGDERALPVLVQRIGLQLDPPIYVDVARPVVIKRNRLAEHFGEVERGVALAIAKIQARGALLILLDSEGECPKELGPALLERVQKARGDIPSAVVLAHKEFECWFLAAAASLRGQRELAADMEPPDNPEEIQGAKEWLRRHMPPTRKYSETSDQPALAEMFDLQLARSRSASFDKCYREIERLLRLLVPPPPASE